MDDLSGSAVDAGLEVARWVRPAHASVRPPTQYAFLEDYCVPGTGDLDRHAKSLPSCC